MQFNDVEKEVYSGLHALGVCRMSDQVETEELKVKLPTILGALIVALVFAAAVYLGEA